MTTAALSSLQMDTLRAFFARERGFFLTGGAALAGFYLHHRHTTDLDLFTVDASAFERGPHVMGAVAEALGAQLMVRQDAPGFRRYALVRGDETLLVDLVHDRVAQSRPQKLERDGVLLDPPEEILVNKLTTVVSRMEERDLVDLMLLERAGHRIEDALPAALAKDGGCTPATLAWLLSEISVSDTAILPGGVRGTELRAFLDDLIRRLRAAALP